MNPKGWFAAGVIVVVACGVAVFDMAFTWPHPEQPSLSVPSTSALGVSLTDFAGGFTEPVAIAFTGIPTDTRMFVVERAGVIRIVQSNGTVLPTPFLNISSKVESAAYGEMGLLGLAFEPDYAASGWF